MAWLTNWNRRKSKTVNGTTAGAQTNYQMKLTVHKGTGTDTDTDVYLGTNVRDDFGDVRFTSSDGSTLLPYWIESYTLGVSATIWINIDYIPASPGTTTIYIYYDNPTATTTSDGSTTFEFFDDFPGTVIDTATKYDLFGTASQNNAFIVSGSNNARLKTKSTYYNAFGVGKIYEVLANINPPNERIAIEITDDTGTSTDAYYGTNNIYRWSLEQNNPPDVRFGGRRGGGTWYDYWLYSYVANTNDYLFRMTAKSSTNIFNELLQNDIVIASYDFTATDITTVNWQLNLEARGTYGSSTKTYKWQRVRKYANPEPTFGSAGIEETPSACPTSPKYSGDTVTLQATPKDGVAPYYVEFRKDNTLIDPSRLNNEPNPIYNAPENTTITRVYTLDDADIAGATTGTIDFSVYIEDSCPTGHLSCTDTCTITIGCTAPVCNFTVT